MLAPGWRDETWDRLAGPWDVLVVGGGISGAGIARRAARAGLRVLLVEQRDLAWGTSSRSSKLVHGGLRYLREGQLGVVRDSVRERERLLRAAPGLVDELGFLMPTYRGTSPGRWTYTAGLEMYDVLAGRRTHRRVRRSELELLAPRLRPAGLTGGFRYADAQTDDARLTMRVALDAVAAGAAILTYALAEDVLRGTDGMVDGARVRDALDPGRAVDVHATVTVSATGAWADRLRSRLGASPRIRPLRGSHLVFPAWRFPVAQAVNVIHPADGRPVFAFPWEGVTLVGTTDVDHDADLDVEPRIAPAEAAYLTEAMAAGFPPLGLRPEHAMASFAGVRPVIGTGRADPSKESRDHAAWNEHGLLTLTGGKLTTFDVLAREALRALRPRFAGRATVGVPAADLPVDPVRVPRDGDLGRGARDLPADDLRRLAGRYGRATALLLAAAEAQEGRDLLERVTGTTSTWAEVLWAARAEGVVHLEDLLLRRVRLGLTLPDGGAAVLDRVREIAQPELGWGDARWEAEEAAYRALWASDYAPPGPADASGDPPRGPTDASGVPAPASTAPGSPEIMAR
jgi:glycerol-3-phosphate dehydrogenase